MKVKGKFNNLIINNMQVVYIEAVLMDNEELIHYGKSLGFITKEQRDLVESGATKLTKGKEAVVAIRGSERKTA